MWRGLQAILPLLAIPAFGFRLDTYSLPPDTHLDLQKPLSGPPRPQEGDGKPLECFQVAQPVLGPSGPVYQGASGSEMEAVQTKKSCSVSLMDHSFGFSYGKPFVGQYVPPDCDFDRVIMNFTVTSSGRQFDRLALMFFNDTEVWRTSTAEPKPAPGIVWTHWKDMTEYLSLWKSPQTLIFDLGNLVDDKYTGSFNCSLVATFFKSPKLRHGDDGTPADLIVPISARKGTSGKSSAWTVPSQQAVSTVEFPRNANRAVFSISANGQMAEEFWWSNVFQSDVNTFNRTAGGMSGLSPFREVQLLIDDQLAGVQWPFPVVFTGGVSPALHRPIVGLEAFDLREHEIDVSAWLPVLCDGKAHTFRIRVVGIDDDQESVSLSNKIDAYWVVTGKIFVWLDDQGSITKGQTPKVESSDPLILISHEQRQDGRGINEALEYSLQVQRTLSVTGKVHTQRGTYRPSWHQELTYTNLGLVASFGTNQINIMNITGTDEASGSRQYMARYSYPLYANTSFSVGSDKSLGIEAQLEQGLRFETRGNTVFSTGLEAFDAVSQDGSRLAGCTVETSRTGKAAFHQSGDGKHSSGFGWTRQAFYFGGLDSGGDVGVALYVRNVTASNDTIVSDHEVSGSSGVRGGERRVLRQVGNRPSPSGAGEHVGQFAPAKGKHTRWVSWGGSGEVAGVD
ncbi:hypothetical protein ACHAQA_001745 [Verticillium albo-atrum]